jgi:pyruvate formate lyase activating enzyme
MACPEGAVSIKDGAAYTDREKCISCGACAALCAFSARERFGEEWDAVSLAEELCVDKLFFITGGGGVTLSGGECLSQPRFALELLKELKKREIHTAIDTCGCVPFEAIEAVIPYTDVFLYDVKAIDPQVHKRCTGRDNAQILANLQKLCARGAKVEVRIPLVVGYNDGEIARIGEFLKDIGVRKVTVLKYHDLARSKYLSLGKADTMPQPLTTVEDVNAAVELLRSYGLNAISGKDD